MCGIVGAIADRDVVPVLIEGLKRLEYRGYDSAGIAVVDGDDVRRVRRTGRVAEMEAAAEAEHFHARLGIGHTRWATHGGVTECNAHPHISHGELALVHNGIIENHEAQRERLQHFVRRRERLMRNAFARERLFEDPANRPVVVDDPDGVVH